MTMGNKYIEQRNAMRQKFFSAGCDTATQQMFDMMCLVLNDPEIMGKDVFGAKRLEKLHLALYKMEDMYHEAWTGTSESDYYQQKLDDALRKIFGEIVPFNKRYPFMTEWNYNKRMKGGK